MENASKALLIAGAILICILIIAVGMYIYSQSQGVIDSMASKMGQQEKQAYNSMIQRYVGDSKKGSDVKLMIDDIISQNNQYVNDTGKFIGIEIGSKGVTGYTGNVGDVCKKANIYKATAGSNDSINNQENVNTATEEMRNLRKFIVSGRNYKVSDVGGTTDGIIHTVTIEEVTATTTP